ncbi:MAG: hypothetical protein R2712_22805 [Vicinamibacterales bacterium]
MVALCGGPTAAAAQMIVGPPGAVGGVLGGHRPVDPNRNAQSLDATFDLGGGYDRDPNVVLDVPGAADLSRWYAGTFSAAGRYRAGSIRRQIEARGRGYVNYQSNANDSLIGGEAVVDGTMRFGPRRLNMLSLNAQSAWEPGWIFGALGPTLAPGTDTSSIGVAPPQGVFEQRWLVVGGSGRYEHHWNLRQFSTVEVDVRNVRPVQGAGLDSDTQTASYEHDWTVVRGFSLIGGYRISQNSQRADGTSLPTVRFQTLDGGVRFERPLPRARHYGVTVRAGATRLFDSDATAGADLLYPSFSALADLTPARSWTISAQVSHAVMVLAGISAAPVANDAVELTITGTPTRRMRYSVSGSVARAQFLARETDSRNVTDVTGVSAELRYAISTWSAVFGSYGYYDHQIDDPSLVSGFPTRYARHSARVGLTLWLPMYGSF